MNVSKINALLNILEGIKATNELLDIPVEWRNAFVDAKNLVRDARDSERSEDGKGYTLIELQQAAEPLRRLEPKVIVAKNVAPHVRGIVKAQAALMSAELHAVIEAIKESRN